MALIFCSLSDGHHMEGEDMIDRVVISQEGDMIEWYCQMVVTSPDSTTDHPTAVAELLPRQERTSGTSIATTTVAGDLGTDEIDETTPAYDRNSKKGDNDEPVTREGHTVPSGEYHHRVEQLDKTAGYPPDIGDKMPPLTHSSPDTESGSGHEESEIFPPPVRKGGVMRGEMGTKTKGYKTLNCSGI
jgi:hypothetical protein